MLGNLPLVWVYIWGELTLLRARGEMIRTLLSLLMHDAVLEQVSWRKHHRMMLRLMNADVHVMKFRT